MAMPLDRVGPRRRLSDAPFFESPFLALEWFELEWFELKFLELYLNPIQVTEVLINHSDDLVKFLGST